MKRGDSSGWSDALRSSGRWDSSNLSLNPGCTKLIVRMHPTGRTADVATEPTSSPPPVPHETQWQTAVLTASSPTLCCNVASDRKARRCFNRSGFRRFHSAHVHHVDHLHPVLDVGVLYSCSQHSRWRCFHQQPNIIFKCAGINRYAACVFQVAFADASCYLVGIWRDDF